MFCPSLAFAQVSRLSNSTVGGKHAISRTAVMTYGDLIKTIQILKKVHMFNLCSAKFTSFNQKINFYCIFWSHLNCRFKFGKRFTNLLFGNPIEPYDNI